MKNVVTNLYPEYLRYIDSFRAIPWKIDALKPVERRLLLTVHEVARTKLQKAAKIVGATIGTLHPHGDQCLVGDTQIYSLDGNIYTIKELIDNNIKELDILSFDIKTKKIVNAKAKFFRKTKEVKKLYKISLSNGGEILCTENHPILLESGEFISAENIKLYSILETGKISSSNNYLSIKTIRNKAEFLHNLVYNNLSKEKSEVIHHIDENIFNNIPSNLVSISRGEHAKHHNDYIIGLENGRVSMFSDNGKYRNATKLKNQELVKELHKYGIIIKAFKVIKLIEQDGLTPTIQLYEKYRKNVYNAPFYNTLLIKKKITNFQDLLDQKNNFKFNSEKSKNFTGKYNKKRDSVTKHSFDEGINHRLLTRASLVIREIITNALKYNNQISYETARNQLISRFGLGFGNIPNRDFPKEKLLYDKFNLNNIKELSELCSIHGMITYITDIEVITSIEPIPVYDFTVDEFENIFIVTGKYDDSLLLNCVHNSTYEALVGLVNRGFVVGNGNFGSLGLDDMSAAAYRYTETKANPVLDNLFGEFLDFAPYQELELELEPLYLPSPIPIGLVGEGMILGIGNNITRTPRYSFPDLIKRTNELITNSPTKTTIIPQVADCDIYEDTPGEFEKILTTGEGILQCVPKHKTNGNRILIYGRNPLWGYSKLKSYNVEYESKNGSPAYNLVDLSKKKLCIQVTPYRGTISPDFELLIAKLISTKIHIICNFVDEDLAVRQFSIDNILISGYNKWKDCYLKSLNNDLSKLQKKEHEYIVLRIARSIYLNNPTVKTVTDICNIYNAHQNKVANVTGEDIEIICSKYSLKKVIELDLDIPAIQSEILSKTNDISNIDILALNKLNNLL